MRPLPEGKLNNDTSDKHILANADKHILAKPHAHVMQTNISLCQQDV